MASLSDPVCHCSESGCLSNQPVNLLVHVLNGGQIQFREESLSLEGWIRLGVVTPERSKDAGQDRHGMGVY
jgi:hypothetical protein